MQRSPRRWYGEEDRAAAGVSVSGGGVSGGGGGVLERGARSAASPCRSVASGSDCSVASIGPSHAAPATPPRTPLQQRRSKTLLEAAGGGAPTAFGAAPSPSPLAMRAGLGGLSVVTPPATPMTTPQPTPPGSAGGGSSSCASHGGGRFGADEDMGMWHGACAGGGGDGQSASPDRPRAAVVFVGRKRVKTRSATALSSRVGPPKKKQRRALRALRAVRRARQLLALAAAVAAAGAALVAVGCSDFVALLRQGNGRSSLAEAVWWYAFGGLALLAAVVVAALAFVRLQRVRTDAASHFWRGELRRARGRPVPVERKV